MNLNHFVKSRTIWELLQRALPEREYISSGDVVNARVKAKLSIKQSNSKGESIETFQYYVDTALGLFRGLDDVNSNFIDKAIQFSKKKFEDYLHDPNHKIKFLAILNKLGTIDPGLTYNFFMDK